MDYEPIREVERANEQAEEERERQAAEERVENHICQFINVYEWSLACTCGRHILKPNNKQNA